MNQDYRLLRDQIKRILKNKKINYAELANRMNVAESSIKRILNAEDCSIERISQICAALEIRFFDLCEAAQGQEEPGFELTEKQEKAFVKDLELFEIFDLLYDERMTPKEITKNFEISRQKLSRAMKRLGELGLIKYASLDSYYFSVHGSLNLSGGSKLSKMTSSYRIPATLEACQSNKQGYYTWSERFCRATTMSNFLEELTALTERYRRYVYDDEVSYPRHQLMPVAWVIGACPIARCYKHLKRKPSK